MNLPESFRHPHSRFTRYFKMWAVVFLCLTTNMKNGNMINNRGTISSPRSFDTTLKSKQQWSSFELLPKNQLWIFCDGNCFTFLLQHISSWKSVVFRTVSLTFWRRPITLWKTWTGMTTGWDTKHKHVNTVTVYPSNWRKETFTVYIVKWLL